MLLQKQTIRFGGIGRRSGQLGRITHDDHTLCAEQQRNCRRDVGRRRFIEYHQVEQSGAQGKPPRSTENRRCPDRQVPKYQGKQPILTCKVE